MIIIYACSDIRSLILHSVEDPGCLSQISYPDFYPLPDPKTATKERGEKKFFVILVPFFVATNFTKLNIILFLTC
jgi:hypothetical protein